MADYAKGTRTAISTTEAQIKAMLQKAGASAVAFFEEPTRAVVGFHLHDRAIQFRLPLPPRDSFRTFPRGFATVTRTAKQMDDAWMQASRERWRQLHLCIKAKLESVAQNIETFDEAFLAHVQMPSGRTVGDEVIPAMTAQLAGAPPRPLLAPPGK